MKRADIPAFLRVTLLARAWGLSRGQVRRLLQRLVDDGKLNWHGGRTRYVSLAQLRAILSADDWAEVEPRIRAALDAEGRKRLHVSDVSDVLRAPTRG